MIQGTIPYVIENYGYLIVFLASLVEGESIIITASILASQGKLDITKVGMLAFLGTLFADQSLFFVGKYWGGGIFNRFPMLARKSVPVFRFLKKYNISFILSFRFIYGIRILSPIVIGASDVSVKRFVFLNFIAAIIWTVLSCAAGYYLGEAIFYFLKKVQGVFKVGFILLLSMIIVHYLHKASRIVFRAQ